jgi:uncharacterized protein (DUF427 family)
VRPYKGTASYWSARVGDRMVEDVAWAYLVPLPDCPRIAGYLCFYPEKVDRIDVEGEPRSVRTSISGAACAACDASG